MNLFPAIDIREGRAVRLLRGDYEKMTVYGDDPVAIARGFKAAGAEYLHLVDLDGAKDGQTPNFELIGRIIKESGLLVEVGGGIRSMESVERYILAGAMRVIIGTAAVTDTDFLKCALEKYGAKIAVGADVKDGFVAVNGWTQKSELGLYDFCARCQELGVKTLICTDISKDGAMEGVNLDMYSGLKNKFPMDIIASGGVTVVEDLQSLEKTGVAGAILGKSLYAGSIDLARAVALMKGTEK